MKKKILFAVLALSAALTVTACGTETKEETTKVEATEEEASSEETEEAEATEEETVEKGEIDPEASDSAAAQEGYGDRIVSVDSVEKYVKLGEYKGIVLDKTVAEVTEEEIDSYIEQLLADAAEEVKDGELQNGDTATIDFTGMKDGEAFDGGTATNYDLEIGSGTFIPGFEDGMLGMKKGETRDLNLTFPESYGEPTLAGQEVVFQVTLQSFKRAPELTEDWVKANTDFETIEAYREDAKAVLKEQAQQNAETALKGTAWQTVLESSEVVEYPEEDYNNVFEEMKAYMSSQMESMIAQSGMEKAEFLEMQGMTEEDYTASIEEQCKQYAEYMLKQNLIVQAIMDAEGITLSDESFDALKTEFAQSYGAPDFESLVSVFGRAKVNESLALLWAENFLVDHAEIQDKISEDETVGVDGEAVEEGEEIEAATEEEIEAESIEETEEAAEEEAEE